jgi:putative acyl-CoA dehydrogenase
VTQSIGFSTHEILNASRPFENINLYMSDGVLRESVGREGAAQHEARLSAFGAWLGTAETAELARQAHAHGPELHAFDRQGRRIDEVEYHPAYHVFMKMGLEAGIAGLPWQDMPAGHVLHAALEYLLAEVEPSTCCPMTMTYAALPALRHTPGIAALWHPKIASCRYDPRLLPISEKDGVTIGMAMTEKQGGSDVRANTTIAEADNGAYRLVGHKWFCSAPMSDAFLTLAQADQGLTCFLVPRLTPDGDKNALHVMRLKDKLGDRANASSEIEYHGAYAERIGEEGRGVATIIEMVHHTRLDCIVAPAAYMRAASAQALWHCQHRKAFGKRLIEQALMRQVLADLALESEAATALAFRIARSFDETPRSEEAALFSRLATPVAKYWLNKRVVPHVAEAMECHGGIGYVLDWPIARLYRQAPLNGIWEGSGNVICLDILRALTREPRAAEVFLSEIDIARGQNDHLDRSIARLRKLLASSDPTEAEARKLAEIMALTLQAALLVRNAPGFVASAFCESRLGSENSATYGTLSQKADIDALLARAMPQL